MNEKYLFLFMQCIKTITVRDKYLMVLFRGRFRRGRDIFDPIVPSTAKDNLEVKHVD